MRPDGLLLSPPDARPGPRPPGEVGHPVPPDGGGLGQLQPPEQPVSPQPASGQRRVVRVSLVQGILACLEIPRVSLPGNLGTGSCRTAG